MINRAELSTNQYYELIQFPASTVFRGTVIAERKDETVFGDEPIIKLSNGAIGYLDAHSKFTKSNPPISVGLEIDVAIKWLTISPDKVELYLEGTWTTAFKKQKRSDSKKILDIGKNVLATLVQKEVYGMFFEYQTCRIFVPITHITRDCYNSGEIMKQFKKGVEYLVRLLPRYNPQEKFQNDLGQITAIC